jgi:hypothetical protein
MCVWRSLNVNYTVEQLSRKILQRTAAISPAGICYCITDLQEKIYFVKCLYELMLTGNSEWLSVSML